MKKGSLLLLTSGLVLLFAVVAWGQYYQYTDENGVLRYTDNLAAVPPDQRINVKTYESVISSPVQAKDSDPLLSKETASALSPEPAEAESTQSARPESNDSWQERVVQREKAAAELDRMQADLTETFIGLQNARNVLAAKKPAREAAEPVKQAYQKQVDALNQKIGLYESQMSVFKKKTAEYNAEYDK
jgi:hypothetical protein